ncbi:MAG: demethoxyubiquinone hydroxylase family protein [Sedimentisphaerales bacterium]|nr:demethoxyubiquinone hydroxylase family protein [Sedimentisphaerales bacterium]
MSPDIMENNKSSRDAERQKANDYDIAIIRPQLSKDDINFIGEHFSDWRLIKIKKGLRTLHTLELMAQTIYKFQITKEHSEINRRLITAMCNEMTHYQDFQVALYEYGFRPSLLRWAYWLVGFGIGFVSRLIGPKAILKVGIWVETKAVHHYFALLDKIEWDDRTRGIIEKNQADEFGHIDRWKEMLEKDILTDN